MRFLASRILIRLAIVAALAIIVGFYWLRSGSTPVKYITAPVTTGPIIRSVIATGTVNPITTVQVGSYVSGPITNIYVDYNSPVKKGQLIAKIDPRPYQVKVDESKAALDDAIAQLAKDRADLAYKKLTYERNAEMLKTSAVSQDTVDSARDAYDQAAAQVELDKANVEQQRANLEEAQVNLDYCRITSPVDGTVISRNVDVGQTVAASFQTPTLFLIGQDLTKMEVDGNVSESDIGDLRAGQPATFTVDAFQGREFDGIVRQVRQAPTTVQNVVTYDVVVDVPNPELLLKPGMTANVTMVTAKRDQAVRIPLAALRYFPRDRAHLDHTADHAAASRQQRVWTLADGAPHPVVVKTGLDDGANAELLKGELHDGDQVVTDEIRTASSSSSGPPSFGPPHH